MIVHCGPATKIIITIMITIIMVHSEDPVISCVIAFKFWKVCLI